MIITILWWGYGKADVYYPKNTDLDEMIEIMEEQNAKD